MSQSNPYLVVPHSVLVTASRSEGAIGRLRDAAAQVVGGPVRVVRGGGRRKGAAEELVADLVSTGVATLVVESLSKLNPVPAKALAMLAAIRTAGLRVIAIADGWAGDADPETLLSVASYLAAAEQKQNSKRGRAAIAVARVNARRVGRPVVKIDHDRAAVLVAQVGFRRAALELGVGATTLRRAMRAA